MCSVVKQSDIWTSKSGPYPWCFEHFDFEMCFAPQRRALFRHLNLKKWSGAAVFCTILTSKCASRHNGVHFFDIGPTLVCFVHFDFEICFAPQRCALFGHLNCQKWPGAVVFSTFWVRHVLRATTACNFSSLIWPAGSAPAALASLLFDPPEPQIIGETLCFATFLPFSRICIFFLLTLSLLLFFLLIFLFSLPLPCAAFHLSVLYILYYIVGSLTSKLPSTSRSPGLERQKVEVLFGCLVWRWEACTFKSGPNVQVVFESCPWVQVVPAMELREGDAWLKHAETAAIICQQFLCLPVTPEMPHACTNQLLFLCVCACVTPKGRESICPIFPTSIQVAVRSIDIRKLLAPTSLRTQSCITAAAWKWRSSSARLSTTLSLWRFFLMLMEQWRRWQMLTPSLLFTLCDAGSWITDPRSEPFKTLQTSPKIGFARKTKTIH